MQPDLVGKALALASALCWGTAIIYFKIAGDHYAPMPLNFYKTVVAFLLLLPVFFIGGISFAPAGMAREDWLRVAVSGVLGVTAADSLFFTCLNMAGAGLAAITECLYSPFVMVLSWLILHERIGPKGICGALLVIAAVLLATARREKESVPFRRAVLGMLAGASAMLLVAAGVIIMKPVLTRASFFWVSEVRLLAAILVFLPLLVLRPRHRADLRKMAAQHGFRSALPGSLLGFLSMVAWVAAFAKTSVNAAAILNQTNAIFVVVLASVWLKEPFTLRRFLATLLAVAGSALVLLS